MANDLSGMAGIGKTSLGESAIAMVISSLNGEVKTSDFTRGFTTMNYLKVVFNDGEHGFEHYYDSTLDASGRFNMRLLSRACR